MLVFSPRMYLDAKLMGKRKRICRILEQKPYKKKVYCITLPVNGDNMMEIYSSQEFWFGYTAAKGLVVIGLAETKQKAQKLLAQICLDVVEWRGDISPVLVRDFFMVQDEVSLQGERSGGA